MQRYTIIFFAFFSLLLLSQLANHVLAQNNINDISTYVNQSPKDNLSNKLNSIETQANIFIANSFEGIHYGYNGPYYNGWVPPDVQIAVSDKYVVEINNVLGAVWYKNGTFISYISLYLLFSVSSYESIGDPRIVYDNSTKRFFASVYDGNINAVLVAVSKTDNPLGSWYVYQFYTLGGYFPDQPYIGFNDKFFVITANDFNGNNYVYSQYWIANKTQMINNEQVNYYTSTDSSSASIRPAVHLSSSQAFYMVSTQTSAPNLIKLYKITGSLPNNLIISTYYLNVNPFSDNLQPAPQLGTSNTIDTGDNRAQDVFYLNGQIWLTANDQCLPSGDIALRTCIRVIEINTSSTSISQDYYISLKNNYLFYGAIRILGNSIPVIVFGFSSQNNYPGIMITYRINNTQVFEIIKNGTGPEITGCNNGVCRYGDYFSAVLDPVNINSVWVAGEYGRGNQGWGTYIAQVSSGFYIKISFSVIGGGTGYSNPILTYYYQFKLRTAVITEQPTIYQVDPNSPWSVNSSLPGSNQVERWATNQTTNGTVNGNLIINLTYYHQYRVLFNYTVIGGGNYMPPYVYWYQFGKPVSEFNVNPFYLWADANSTYNYTNPLQSQSTLERWISLNSTGKIDGPKNINVVYYHQYLVTINLNFVGQSTISNVMLSYVQFGINKTYYFKNNFTDWFDAYSHWKVPNLLPGSNQTERWISFQNTTGIVTSGGKINLLFYHQYHVTIKLNPSQAATTNIQSGWYNENAEIKITIQTNTGWKFIKWIGEGQGAYNGSNENITLVIKNPITEIGIFYAEVTISSSTGITVLYDALNITGTISEGNSITLYLPVNTTLNLKANSNSPLYMFTSWSGTKYSTDNNLSMAVNGPVRLSANSSLNIIFIGISVFAVAIAIVITLIIIQRRKSNK